MNGRVYAAAYWYGPHKARGDSELAKEFESQSRDRLYDIGDDPSFFSAFRLDGAVTWGVCRGRLRNSLRVGDVMTFFVAEELADRSITYSFRGFGVVEKKISQVTLWQDHSFSEYQRYLNLLIRPSNENSGEFEWHEEVENHPDWLWRICDRRGYRESDLRDIQASGQFRPNVSKTSNGASIRCADNYVVFDPSRSKFLVDPLPVAMSPPRSAAEIEVWSATPLVRSIRSAVLDNSSSARTGSRGLKSVNVQRMHPHLALDLVDDTDDWLNEISEIMDQL